jgi:hypothetical protein
VAWEKCEYQILNNEPQNVEAGILPYIR